MSRSAASVVSLDLAAFDSRRVPFLFLNQAGRSLHGCNKVRLKVVVQPHDKRSSPQNPLSSPANLALPRPGTLNYITFALVLFLSHRFTTIIPFPSFFFRWKSREQHHQRHWSWRNQQQQQKSCRRCRRPRPRATFPSAHLPPHPKMKTKSCNKTALHMAAQRRIHSSSSNRCDLNSRRPTTKRPRTSGADGVETTARRAVAADAACTAAESCCCSSVSTACVEANMKRAGVAEERPRGSQEPPRQAGTGLGRLRLALGLGKGHWSRDRDIPREKRRFLFGTEENPWEGGFDFTLGSLALPGRRMRVLELGTVRTSTPRYD